jgi:O-antigen/teichoic acid export membrane protein
LVSEISIVELGKAISTLVIIVVLISHFEIFGVLLGMFLGNLIILIYSFIKSTKFRLLFDIDILKELLKIGVPLLIYNLGFYIFSSIDRLFILSYLTERDLGLYTFANQMSSATLIIISSILYLNYPKALRHMNMKNSSKEEILKYSSSFTIFIEIIGVILIFMGMVIIPPFVRLILPQYTDSIPIFIILIAGVVFSRVVFLYNVSIVSNGKEMMLVYFQIFSIIIAILLNYLFVNYGFGLVGIASATFLIQILYAFFEVFYSYKLLGINRSLFKTFSVLYKLIIFSSFIFAIVNLDIGYYLSIIFTFIIICMLFLKRILKIFKYKFLVN